MDNWILGSRSNVSPWRSLGSLVAAILVAAACGGTPTATPPAPVTGSAATSTAPSPGTTAAPTASGSPSATAVTSNVPTGAPQSLLPDGSWQVNLTDEELVAAGAHPGALPTGQYTWTFDA